MATALALDQPHRSLLRRLLKQQLPRLLDGATRHIPGALDALVAVAVLAAEIGGCATARGEPQPPLDTSVQATVARSVRRKLMALYSQCGSIEASGWPRIAAAMLPRRESTPMLAMSPELVMHLAVGNSTATPRSHQQVGAQAPLLKCVLHPSTCTRVALADTSPAIMHACTLHPHARRRCSMRCTAARPVSSRLCRRGQASRCSTCTTRSSSESRTSP